MTRRSSVRNLEDDARVVEVEDLNRLVRTSDDHERVLHVQRAEKRKKGASVGYALSSTI